MTSPSSAKRFRTARPTPKSLLPLLLIVCEGGKTEPHYFEKWEREHSNKITIRTIPASGSDPKSIVDSAIKIGREFADKNPSIWCVGDADNYRPGEIKTQMKRAEDKGFHYLLTVPCFELWIVLHFQDQNAPISIGDVQDLSWHHLPNRNLRASRKSLSVVQREILHDKYDHAIRRAKKLERDFLSGGNAFPQNPRTDIWKLLEHFETY